MRHSLCGLESPYANELHSLLNKREVFMSAPPLWSLLNLQVFHVWCFIYWYLFVCFDYLCTYSFIQCAFHSEYKAYVRVTRVCYTSKSILAYYSCCSIYDVLFAQYANFLSNYLVIFARMSGKHQKLNSVWHSILNISAIIRNIKSRMLINRIHPV